MRGSSPFRSGVPCALRRRYSPLPCRIWQTAGVALTAVSFPAAALGSYTFVNVVDTNSSQFTLGLSDPNINNTGTVAFVGQSGSLSSSVTGIYTTSSSGGGPIATIVDNTGTYTNVSFYPALNDNGTVAFTANADGGSGVFTGSGHAISTVYQSSTTGPFASFSDGIYHPSINKNGAVAFYASYNFGYAGIDAFNGIFSGTGGSSFNDIWDSSDGSMSVGSPSINSAGQVAFGSSSEVATGSGNNNFTVLASTGGTYNSFGQLPTINSGGMVAFQAGLTAGGTGIFLYNGQKIIQLAAAKTDNGTGLQYVDDPVVNASGQAAFGALTYNSTIATDVTGIYTGSDPVADKVIAYGDSLFGSTVQSVSNFLGFNDAGQVAFAYNLKNGDAGIAVASPIVVAPTLTWNNTGAAGPGDGKTWDVGVNNNWNNGSSATSYIDGSNVIFNDSNNSHYAVTLNTIVGPNSITVNNSANNYSITGTGSIAGSGSLTKNGTSSVTLGTVNTYAGGTVVNAGTLIAGASGAIPDHAVTITNGTLRLAASTGLQTISSLSITGNGAFDLTNNHVIINYGSGPDPIASITTLLATGYNNGSWNGAGGIVSSTAAANSASYGLGYADSTDSGNPAGLSSGQIEIAYTLLGDANLDRTVNGVDFGILAANFNKGITGWDKGDFNYDNTVNGVDFADLAANFNKGASGAADSWASLVAFAEANGLMADVPEPACATLLLASAGMLSCRRKRR